MRILLVDPPYYRFFGGAYQEVCVGICSLATVLDEAGHEVAVYHADFSPNTQFPSNLQMFQARKQYLAGISDSAHPIWEEMIATLERFDPDLIGMTLLTSKYGAARMLARFAKARDPSVRVVVGGAHPTILPEPTLRENEFDIVIRGEGERTIVELAAALENDAPLDDIDGVSWSEGERLIHNRPRALIADLDSLPFSNRELLLRRHQFPRRALGVLVTSRGCPFRCQFCSSHLIWTRKVRYRSIANVLQEIREIYGKYGVRRFSFFDDTFTLHRDRVTALCESLIEDGPTIAWACTTRADTVDAALMRTMRAAGCEDVFIGLESASDRVLNRIGKRITAAQVAKVSRAATDAGLYPTLSMMIGLPGETADDIREDIRFIRALDPYNPRPNIAKPFPGTEFYAYARERGILPDTLNWSELFVHNPTYNLAELPDETFTALAEEVYTTFHALERRHVKERLASMEHLEETTEEPREEGKSRSRFKRLLQRARHRQ